MASAWMSARLVNARVAQIDPPNERSAAGDRSCQWLRGCGESCASFLRRAVASDKQGRAACCRGSDHSDVINSCPAVREADGSKGGRRRDRASSLESLRTAARTASFRRRSVLHVIGKIPRPASSAMRVVLLRTNKAYSDRKCPEERSSLSWVSSQAMLQIERRSAAQRENEIGELPGDGRHWRHVLGCRLS
jgi:hypothetical protein